MVFLPSLPDDRKQLLTYARLCQADEREGCVADFCSVLRRDPSAFCSTALVDGIGPLLARQYAVIARLEARAYLDIHSEYHEPHAILSFFISEFKRQVNTDSYHLSDRLALILPRDKGDVCRDAIYSLGRRLMDVINDILSPFLQIAFRRAQDQLALRSRCQDNPGYFLSLPDYRNDHPKGLDDFEVMFEQQFGNREFLAKRPAYYTDPVRADPMVASDADEHARMHEHDLWLPAGDANGPEIDSVSVGLDSQSIRDAEGIDCLPFVEPERGSRSSGIEPILDDARWADGQAGKRLVRSTKVNEFLKACSRTLECGAGRVYKCHIWKLAGHKASKQFEHWEAGRDQRPQSTHRGATGEDVKNFGRIVELAPHEFFTELKEKKIPLRKLITASGSEMTGR